MTEKRIHVLYGENGHETEFMVKVDNGPYTEAESVPSEWKRALQDKLGSGWLVYDRGNRIEVMQPESVGLVDADNFIRQALLVVAGSQFAQSEKSSFPEQR